MTTIDQNVDSKLTDEIIAKYRARIGEVTPITEAWNSEATYDTIRHFANGIGDDNPLWNDEEYAKSTAYGDMIAPPSFLFTCNQGPLSRGRTSGGFRGFTGVHRYWSSDGWEYFHPIKRGDRIHGETYLTDFIEHKSAYAGRTIEDSATQTFYNQRGEKIATHRLNFINFERSTAARAGKYKDMGEHVWTQDELESLWADIEKEERRGAEPRYWEDVEVGGEIPWVVKGPLSQCEGGRVARRLGRPFPHGVGNRAAHRPEASQGERARTSTTMPPTSPCGRIGTASGPAWSERARPTTSAASASRGSSTASPTGAATTPWSAASTLSSSR